MELLYSGGACARGRVGLGGAIAAVVLFLAVAIERTVYFRYQINPDGVAYAEIARRYAALDLRHAVNGYWGPAVSWAMAPFVRFGIEPLFAFRAINLVICGACILLVWLLVARLAHSLVVRVTCTLTCAAMLLAWSITTVTPDLMMVAAFFLYLPACISAVENGFSFRRAYKIGLAGGLMFLVKPFGMLFFHLSFVLITMTLMLVLRDRYSPKEWFARGVAGLGGFWTIGLPWLGLLWWRYGELSLGSSGRYNLTLTGPGRDAESVTTAGLLEPAFAGAVTPSIDVAAYEFKQWNPIASGGDMLHLLRNMVRNLLEIVWSLYLPLGLAVAICMIGIVFGAHRTARKPGAYLVLLVVGISYLACYSLILVEDRYLWPVYILLVVLSFVGIDHIVRDRNSFAQFVRFGAVGVVALLIVLGPVLHQRTLNVAAYSPVIAMYGSTERDAVIGRETKETAARFQSSEPACRVASNSNYGRSVNIAYYWDVDYYGQIRRGTAPEAALTEMDRFHIDCLLWWGRDPIPASILEWFAPVQTGMDGSVTLYVRHSTAQEIRIGD